MATTAATATGSSEEELMLRLQSQFGDLDLTNLVPNGQPQQQGDDEESEESSIAEPTPEELRAWQEAQFQKGQEQVQAKKDAAKSAVQRRREDLQNKKAEDEDWEEIHAVPKLKDSSSVFFPTTTEHGTEILGCHPLLQQICMEGDAPDILGTQWHRLFSSADGDGLSFLKLWSRLDGYPGPTVLLISAVPSKSKTLSGDSNATTITSPTTIGFFTTSPWIESNGMTGSSDCFLFAFQQDDTKVQFFCPKQNNPQQQQQNGYMYCHPSSAIAPSNVAVHGLGVGGTPSQLRLHLTESLEECRALDYCTLFEAGDLLLGTCKASLNYFDVAALEVWAVGGPEWIDESLATQAKQQGIAEANRIKARTVDKQQMWKECFQPAGHGVSGLRGSGALFAHQGYSDGRCDV